MNDAQKISKLDQETMNKYGIEIDTEKNEAYFTFIFGGQFGCFSQSSGLDKTTYPVITPSAVSGVCGAVYQKIIDRVPMIIYEPQRIEILNPIQYHTIKLNGIKDVVVLTKNNKVTKDNINVEESRTQCTYNILRDLSYRIKVKMRLNIHNTDVEECNNTIQKHIAMFSRRLIKGTSALKPCLGLSRFPVEFIGFSSQIESEKDKQSIDFYDDRRMFYGYVYANQFATYGLDEKVLKEFETDRIPVYFDAKITNGVLDLPNAKELYQNYLGATSCQ